MLPIHKNENTEEMMMQAMQCKDADELIALAKTGGYEITKEEAEAYMAGLEDFELEDEQPRLVAGGKGWQNCQEPYSHLVILADRPGTTGNTFYILSFINLYS